MLDNQLTFGGAFSFFDYLKTLITKAVVCGGILAVIKDAWRTRTRSPGNNCEKAISLPNTSKIRASLGTLNLIVEDILLSLIVVKLRDCLSILIILPMVIVLSGGGLKF